MLGPVLFLLFISDINSYISSDTHLLKYADDILVYLLGNFDASLPQAIVDGVQAWCVANRMRLNTTKCKLISFGLGFPLPSVMLNGVDTMSSRTSISASSSTLT